MAMKTMTCAQLGGACDVIFTAETFDEIGELSKANGAEMMQKGDPAHLQAMQAMMDLMQDPEAMGKWFEDKRAEFDALPDDV